MSEYFVFSNSFAAPFFSDSYEGYVIADTPKDALKKYVNSYSHPAGLYFAALYGSADEYHKRKDPLITWSCNHEIELKKRTKDLGCYSLLGHGPGDFVLNSEHVTVKNPKQGQFKENSHD